MLRSRNRVAGMDESVAAKIKEHQRELVKQKQEEGLARFADGESGKKGSGESAFKKLESYRRESQLPSRVDEQRVSHG